MKKLLQTTAVAVCVLTAGAASAESTVTVGIGTLSGEIDGTTFSGVIGYGVGFATEISPSIEVDGSAVIISAGGVSALVPSVGLEYLIQNDLDTSAGTGSKIGIGIDSALNLTVSSEMAAGPDLLVSFGAGIGLNGASTIGYDVGVEYTPVGIFANYSSAVVSSGGVTGTMNGFTVGTKIRF